MWNREITIIDTQNKVESYGRIDEITDDYCKAVKDAELIFITVPSFLIKKTFDKISPYVKENASIGVIPGTGGAEFFISDILDKGCTFFGTQRVPGIARIKEYGKSVYMTGRRKLMYLAAIPTNNTNKICNLLFDLFNIECEPLNNYLCVTLTPSNPILHTTRLYNIFKDYIPGTCWEKNIAFYEAWDNETSELLFKCDSELQELCFNLNKMDLSAVKSLKLHYEANTYEELTAKIRSIPAFKNIYAPMIRTNEGYIPDFESRYFTEDFPYGLCIIKGFCTIANVDTPNIDQVLRWYERFFNQEYFTETGFNGRNLNNSAVPQLFGLRSKSDIYNFYGI